ncbi:MAG: FliM/FliN family flagellar motor switch protein [Pirellulales bacterium]
MTEQVHRSHVTLEARIKLTPLKLGTIAKLAPGDVIPFFDEEDVHVEVNANGKELYACEFGRSGQNYTVRISDNTTLRRGASAAPAEGLRFFDVRQARAVSGKFRQE